MKNTIKTVSIFFAFAVAGIAIAAAGIYIGETDDAPGAAIIGILLMIGLLAFGVRTVRRSAAPTMEK